MNPEVFWKSAFKFQLVPVFITPAVESVIDEATLRNMIDKADQARDARGITIKQDQMYYIRLQLPPNPRLVTVMFLWMNDQVQGFVAYYDEIAHLIENAGPDFKKLPGNPFDTSRV